MPEPVRLSPLEQTMVDALVRARTAALQQASELGACIRQIIEGARARQERAAKMEPHFKVATEILKKGRE